MPFTELIDFSGGINTQNADYLIGQNEAVYTQNGSISNGNILAIKDKNKIGTAVGESACYYSAHNTVVSSSEDRFYVEYSGYLYWSNSAGLMKRYDGTTISDVGGWTTPSVLPTVSATVNTGYLNGDYWYTYTYLHENLFESAPSGIVHVTVANKTVQITFTDTPPSTATHRKLYRSGGVNPTQNLLVTLPVATTTYVDNIDDFSISREELATYNNTPPPLGLDMLIEQYGIFLGALGDKVYFSRQGQPEHWSPYSYVKLPKNVTGLGTIGGSAIAFTKDAMFMIQGSSNTDISITKLPFRYGCANKRTVKNLDGILIWYSQVAGKDIICGYDGSTVTQLSDKFPSFTSITIDNLRYDDMPSTATYNNYSLTPRWAEVFDKKYYIAQDNRITVLDFNAGFRIYCLLETVDSLFKASNDLCAVIGTDLYNLYPSLSTYRSISHRTGKYIDGSYATYKSYRRVRAKYSGSCTISVIVDDKEVISSTDSTFYLPAETVGRAIQFNIKFSGYGQFNSLAYEYQALTL